MLRSLVDIAGTGMGTIRSILYMIASMYLYMVIDVTGIIHDAIVNFLRSLVSPLLMSSEN